MELVDKLLSKIDAGRLGYNAGLHSGLDKLDTMTYGILRENITLIGGSSGSGKSSLALYMAVYNAYKDYLASDKSIDVHWLIFSFEMSEESLMLRLLSMHLWDEYQLIASHSTLLSLDSRLDDEIYQRILDSKQWLAGLIERCKIIDRPVTAKSLYGQCKAFAESHGKFVIKASGIKNGEEWEAYDYIPNDSNQYLIVLVDHVKLFNTQTGHTSKQEIDEACKYLIHFRDKCKFTIYMVQQLNRGFQDMARRTENAGAYQDIQLNDFSDTGDTVNASNTVLAIFFPFRERLAKWKEYIIDPKRSGLGDRCRTVSILKNRDGCADKFVATAFYGEAHIWRELPKPDEIVDYEIYKTLKQ